MGSRQVSLQIEVLEEFEAAQHRFDQLETFYTIVARRQANRLQYRRDWGKTWWAKQLTKAYRKQSDTYKAALKRRKARYRAAHKVQHAAYMRKWRTKWTQILLNLSLSA